MFCPKCGKELEPMNKFCKHCGAPVDHLTSTNSDSQNTTSPNQQKGEQKTTTENNMVERTGEFGALGVIMSLVVKIAIVIIMARVFVRTLDNLGMLGGVLVIFDPEIIYSGLAIVGFLEFGLAAAVKKFPNGGIDRAFLLLPIIPVLITAVLVVLNLGQFFKSLGIFEGSIALVLLAGGYYCCNMTYTVRFRKKALKEQMSNMTDEEIEELKEYTAKPDEIDKMKAECEAESKQEEK